MNATNRKLTRDKMPLKHVETLNLREPAMKTANKQHFRTTFFGLDIEKLSVEGFVPSQIS